MAGGGGRGGPWPPYCKIEPDTQVTPVVETRQKIVNVVGIFVVKHWKKCYGNREKCHESKCNVIVRKIFLPKKLSTGGGGLKCCCPKHFFPIGVCRKSTAQKHGSHGATVVH